MRRNLKMSKSVKRIGMKTRRIKIKETLNAQNSRSVKIKRIGKEEKEK